jgi:hypothetical protein
VRNCVIGKRPHNPFSVTNVGLRASINAVGADIKRPPVALTQPLPGAFRYESVFWRDQDAPGVAPYWPTGGGPYGGVAGGAP